MSTTKAIKNSDHKLQLNGSYMKPDTMYTHDRNFIYNAEIRPLLWFKMFAGQLIYAASETGFNGYLEIVNDEHAAKLCDAQSIGYRFHSLVGIGKRFYESELKIEEEKREGEYNVDEFRPHHWDIYKELLAEAQEQRMENENSHLPQNLLPSQDLMYVAYNMHSDTINSLKSYLAEYAGKADVDEFHSTSIALRHLIFNYSTINDAEDLEYLIEKIIEFLFNPTRLKEFCEGAAGEFDPKSVYNDLLRIQQFFGKMYDEVIDAELELQNIKDWPWKYNLKMLRNVQRHAADLLTIQKATNETYR